MKKIFLLAGMLFSVSLFAQEDFKRHNFGIGIGGSSFPMTYDYSHNVGYNATYDVTNALSFNASLIYEYSFCPRLSLSFQPSYINQMIELRIPYGETVLGDGSIRVSNGYNSFNIHQISLPILVNYKFKLDEKVNLLTALGVGCLVNTSKTPYDKIYSSPSEGLKIHNTLDAELLARLGIEVLTKRKFQILMTYRVNPVKNYEFEGAGTNSFRVGLLDLGVNIFI